jgi:hypothetical protein
MRSRLLLARQRSVAKNAEPSGKTDARGPPSISTTLYTPAMGSDCSSIPRRARNSSKRAALSPWKTASRGSMAARRTWRSLRRACRVPAEGTPEVKKCPHTHRPRYERATLGPERRCSCSRFSTVPLARRSFRFEIEESGELGCPDELEHPCGEALGIRVLRSAHTGTWPSPSAMFPKL